MTYFHPNHITIIIYIDPSFACQIEYLSLVWTSLCSERVLEEGEEDNVLSTVVGNVKFLNKPGFMTTFPYLRKTDS